MPTEPNPRRRRMSPCCGSFPRITMPLLPIVLGAFAVGCEAPPAATGPTTMRVRVSDYEAFVDDALSTLRRNDFAPSFVDREAGVIVTDPATSAQWFELWRGDARGPYNALESSLHTVRRRVTLQVDQLAGQSPVASAATPPTTAASAPRGGEFALSMRVEKERYSAPERQVTTASGALGIYNERLPTSEGLIPRGYAVRWTPLGRDPLLESHLLEEIARGHGGTIVVAPPGAAAEPQGVSPPRSAAPAPSQPLAPLQPVSPRASAQPAQARPAPDPARMGELRRIESP